VRDGARVRVGGTGEGASVAGARDAAVAAGAESLKRALGHDALNLEVEKVQVSPSGAGFRAYVLASGE
jgi:hypothetical protein